MNDASDMEVAMLTPNGNISKRKTVQLMIALTILAWATQTLMHQWGFGAEVAAANSENAMDASQAASRGDGGGAEQRFVPVNAAARGAPLELRIEASVGGTEIKLKQLCR